ncbi:MAG TPA: YciI family protein [Vicinamibacterales bacterium]|nr:YciI family protein [Vicinamibacterales bacterium]
MPKFMLLLHDRPKAFTGLSPAEMQQVVQKYIAWGRKLKAKKLLAESHKLALDPGRVVRQTRGRPMVSDGPYAESKELLGGYFIVKARDYDEALTHALDCPHLEYGTIEVRRIDQP